MFKVDVECLFDEKHLSVETDLLMVYAESLIDLVSSAEFSYKIKINSGYVFQDKGT